MARHRLHLVTTLALCAALLVLTAPAPPSGSPAASAPRTFPTRQSAGLPAEWQPARTVDGDVWVREAGAVVEDLRVVGGTIYVDAPGVTLRRIEAVGSRVVNDYRNVCQNGLVIEDSAFLPQGPTSDGDLFVLGPGGYTARNVVVDGVAEGLRVSGVSEGCDGVTIEDSFIRVVAPEDCTDWHGDGIQGYDGGHLLVRSTTVILQEREGCAGTAPFFYPADQGNTSLEVDGLLVSGGGYAFRNGMPGTVADLKIVDETWGYAPVDVRCAQVPRWSAQVVRLDAAGQPVPLRPVSCTGDGS